MGNGNLVNKRPCPSCGSDKKYKNCCRDNNKRKMSELSNVRSILVKEDKKKIDKVISEPFLTGVDAENLVEFLSQKTFLKPWVFKSPKYCDDNKEFTDVAIFFKSSLILLEVKGNKFDSSNPQRYLKEAKARHRQLIHSKNIVKGNSKKVLFQNEYFSFESNFNNVKDVYLISVSTGTGEMEVSSGTKHIDYSKLNHLEVGKYMGFFDPETNIHSFTIKELDFASKHIDTIKDFLWYLDFEKKYLSSDFKSKKVGQRALAVVDEHREDLISTYILNYYWDDELNRTGIINLNKILGNHTDLSKTDMVVYFGSDTRNYLEEDETYKRIKKEKKISYFWDNLIQHTLSNYEFAYKLTYDKTERQNINIEEVKEILEEMSSTSRLERVVFSEKIKETDEKGLNYRSLFSLADDARTLFSYYKVNYKKFPSQEEQNKMAWSHLYRVWCRIEFGEKFSPLKDKIKKTLLITRHVYEDQSALSFVLSDEIEIDKGICEQIGAIY